MVKFCNLVGSKCGKVISFDRGIENSIYWPKLVGNVTLYDGLFSLSSKFFRDNTELKKMEISSEYLDYTSQIENNFDTDLPDYVEKYINRYGMILEKINSYEELTLNQRYLLRKSFISDAVFVEKSSLVFLKDICSKYYDGVVTNEIIDYCGSKLLSKDSNVCDIDFSGLVDEDILYSINSICNLRLWKNDTTLQYFSDFSSEDEFGKFMYCCENVIINVAYMIKNYLGTDNRQALNRG